MDCLQELNSLPKCRRCKKRDVITKQYKLGIKLLKHCKECLDEWKEIGEERIKLGLCRRCKGDRDRDGNYCSNCLGDIASIQQKYYNQRISCTHNN